MIIMPYFESDIVTVHSLNSCGKLQNIWMLSIGHRQVHNLECPNQPLQSRGTFVISCWWVVIFRKNRRLLMDQLHRPTMQNRHDDQVKLSLTKRRH